MSPWKVGAASPPRPGNQLAAGTPLLPRAVSAQQTRAKRYEAIHNWLFVVETALALAALVVFLSSGGSRALADWTRGVAGNPWRHVALYGAGLVVATKLLFLPLNFFGGFWLEHRFGLSNETRAGWALDELKSLGLNLVLGVVALDRLLHDHPSLGRRIKWAERWGQR